MKVGKFDLYKIKSEDTIEEEDLCENRLYTISGKHDFLDKEGYPRLDQADGVQPLAEMDTSAGRTRYFVKRSRDGKLFNPIGMYSEGQEERFMNHRGENQWLLKECNSVVFLLYIKFLKTKNSAWIRNAEREI